jgi:hypothetical protein
MSYRRAAYITDDCWLQEDFARNWPVLGTCVLPSPAFIFQAWFQKGLRREIFI